MQIKQVGGASNVLSIRLNGQSKIRLERTIDTLMSVFIKAGIEDRQNVSENTINFINGRFEILAQELDTVENQNKDFKQNRRIFTLEDGAASKLSIIEETTSAINEINLQIKLANQLKSNLFKNSNEDISLLPNILTSDTNINSAISEYNTLVSEYKSNLRSGGGINNPRMLQIVSVLESSKEGILQSIVNYIKDLELKRKVASNLKNEFDAKLALLPRDEKVLRSIQRQQKIKESLYILLLQKREEAYINKAITAPSAKIIEYSMSNDAPISPKPRTFYAIALFVGLIIPIASIFLIYFLDTKIHTKEDIEKLAPNIPLVAEIPFMKDNQPKFFKSPSDSTVIAEAFRILSSNVNYVLPTKIKNQAQVIFTTSTTKGEGKTFTSINLSLALSALNKKVLLIGADLRNPQIHKHIGLSKSTEGLTEYLHDESFNWKNSILRGFEKHPNHAVLLSGIIPPNPTQLLSNGRFHKLLQEAKNDYDFIIVDTAPTILVTDTMIISKYADATVYLTRSAFTEKNIIEHSVKLAKAKKLNNIVYVLNGIGQSDKYAFRYKYGLGYGYNYGYGYGYGA